MIELTICQLALIVFGCVVVGAVVGLVVLGCLTAASDADDQMRRDGIETR